MRICDLTTLYIDGGAGGVNTYLHEKARFLADLGGAEHTIIVPAARSERRKLFGSTVHAVRSPRLPWDRQHRVLSDFRIVRRALEEAAPDVVEVDCSHLLGYLASTVLETRGPLLVGFYHVHLPFYAARMGRRHGSPVARVAERLAWRYLQYCTRPLSRILVPSTEILERLRARGLERLEHVPLGVNLDLFRPEERPPAPTRTVLYVGRLSEEKDLRVLFEAYRALAAKRPELRLMVVGDGPLRGMAEEMARTRGDVTVSGLCPYGPELARLYARAAVLAVPGRNETFGLAVLEAFASGLPVVATRRGGPAELIAPEVGALARPGDPGDLAAQLERVLDRGSAAGRCRRHAERHYSWERTFSRLLEIYDRAGAPRRRSPRASRVRQTLDPISLRQGGV